MSKKVLFLHGFGESSLLAGMSTMDLKDVLKGGGYELLPTPDGFQKLQSASECEPITDVRYRKMVQAGDLDAFSWYPLVKGLDGGHRTKGKDFQHRAAQSDVTEAVTKLVDYITKLGGVDAIAGFSQGGELAYLSCASTSASPR